MMNPLNAGEANRTGTAGRFARGFTLLELLLVMTLSALLLTLVPASFSAMLPYVEQKAEIRHLVMALRSARGMAIRERREIGLTLDLKHKRYYLEETAQISYLSDALRLDYRPGFAENGDDQQVVTIRFFPDGSSNGGQLTLKTADAGYRISIDWLTGRVRYHEAV
jgi:general secretion pathway protein H